MSGINVVKMADVRATAVLRHNLRLGRRHSNPHIDPALSRTNTYLTVGGQSPSERYRSRVDAVRAHRPKGRRWREDTVTMLGLVVDLPADFPHVDDRRLVDEYFADCVRTLAPLVGGWRNVMGAQVHRDEVHRYRVSPSVLEAEGVPVKPGDPPVYRTSRIHMHVQVTPILTPEEIERITGRPVRARSRKGRRPQGEWFAGASLVTRPWLLKINREIQTMTRERWHCRYEAKASYSSAAEVEQLKIESAVAEQAGPLVARARERAETDRRKASEVLAEARRRDEESINRRKTLDDREADLDRREKSFRARVRAWEREMKVKYVDRLRSWLESELDKARKVFGRAREEGFAAGRAEGYRAGVEQGVRARESAPAAPWAASVSDERVRAVEALGAMLRDDPDAVPSHADGRPYTREEWQALPPARRRALLDRMAPVAGRGRVHERVL